MWTLHNSVGTVKLDVSALSRSTEAWLCDGCITLEVLGHPEIDTAAPVQASRNRYTYITLCDTRAELEIRPNEGSPKISLRTSRSNRLNFADSLRVEGLSIEI
jgi:hypothetical protein